MHWDWRRKAAISFNQTFNHFLPALLRLFFIFFLRPDSSISPSTSLLAFPGQNYIRIYSHSLVFAFPQGSTKLQLDFEEAFIQLFSVKVIKRLLRNTEECETIKLQSPSIVCLLQYRRYLHTQKREKVLATKKNSVKLKSEVNQPLQHRIPCWFKSSFSPPKMYSSVFQLWQLMELLSAHRNYSGSPTRSVIA